MFMYLFDYFLLIIIYILGCCSVFCVVSLNNITKFKISFKVMTSIFYFAVT